MSKRSQICPPLSASRLRIDMTSPYRILFAPKSSSGNLECSVANYPKQIPTIFIYHFILTFRLVRPGNQINRTVKSDPEHIVHGQPSCEAPGTRAAGLKCNSSDFWPQGINVALTFRF